MDWNQFHPLESCEELLFQFATLPPHIGDASLQSQLIDPNHPLFLFNRKLNPNAPEVSDVKFRAAAAMPCTGSCLFFLQCQPDFRLQRNWGKELEISGNSPDGAFRLKCDKIYVESEGECDGKFRWAIAHQVNKPAELSYGSTRPIASVTALINNFDFDWGNEPKDTGTPTTLRVTAGGKIVDFQKRGNHEQLKTLLRLGLLRHAPLVEFSFAAWPGANEADLTDYSHDVAALCSVVATQHVGIPVLTFVDEHGKPIKKLLSDPLVSTFREGYLVAHLSLDRGLPQVFKECFDKIHQWQDSDRWRPILAHNNTVHDQFYLEQKFATLMAGLERIIRNSLVDAGIFTEAKADSMLLPELLGAAKKQLKWDIPKHYTANDRPRLLRNAVSHGGELPFPPKQVRADLDKWSLFLSRRILIHLGFTGPVRSPDMENRQWGESQVSDFSENSNSFAN